MAHEAERAAYEAIAANCGATHPTPPWLQRPDRSECGERWELIVEIHRLLEGEELEDVMPSRETRRVDGVFQYRGRWFLFELDETQHFNAYRAKTLEVYPPDLALAFGKDAWIGRCREKVKLEGGGWARPRPPLFPGANGRHRQRAFRDALADLVPSVHGFLPTLRLGDREIDLTLSPADAKQRMAELLRQRLDAHVS